MFKFKKRNTGGTRADLNVQKGKQGFQPTPPKAEAALRPLPEMDSAPAPYNPIGVPSIGHSNVTPSGPVDDALVEKLAGELHEAELDFAAEYIHDHDMPVESVTFAVLGVKDNHFVPAHQLDDECEMQVVINHIQGLDSDDEAQFSDEDWDDYASKIGGVISEPTLRTLAKTQTQTVLNPTPRYGHEREDKALDLYADWERATRGLPVER
ncbi:hypothetical protein [Aeromicrobium sp. 179-A 4D2 NHS]|uniref:hypothetical protein n=1 Tax=Aeromicrobium sp. 179-A 4D2 NHS TaxID=3142375 RepID=UPI0039A05A58